jgi:DNA-binding FadR family transcriptional regulator
MVARFGVSRTVAREALQTLSMLGLVHVQHGKRTEVLPPENWNVLTPIVQEALQREGRIVPVIKDLYEFRLLIEPTAAAWMAERGAEKDLEELSRLAAEMRAQAGDAANAPLMMAADQAFHALIARSGVNRVLAAVSRNFWDAIPVLWAQSRMTLDEMRRAAEDHQRIAAVIAERDPSGAAQAMRDHLSWASQLDVGQLAEDRPLPT